MPEPDPVVHLDGVGVRRGGIDILRDITWRVEPGQNWLLLGPNGAGKTTLLSLVGAYGHPTTGTVEVLGHRIGRTDLRALRSRIGMASPALARQLRTDMTAADVVLSGRRGALETWWHTYSAGEAEHARALLARVGLGVPADHEIRTLSTGELRQVQLARALVGDPDLLLLDEPASGLDLGARERLLGRLGELLASRDAGSASPSPAEHSGAGGSTILVTHHLEEIPVGISHAALLARGEIVAQGPIDDCLTGTALSECFELALTVRRHGERWACTAR